MNIEELRIQVGKQGTVLESDNVVTVIPIGCSAVIEYPK